MLSAKLLEIAIRYRMASESSSECAVYKELLRDVPSVILYVIKCNDAMQAKFNSVLSTSYSDWV